MLFMVIERFRNGPDPVRARFADRGRMLPEGVKYISSWITEDGETCYQVMEAASAQALQSWIDNWSDRVDFEVHAVMTSEEFNKQI